MSEAPPLSGVFAFLTPPFEPPIEAAFCSPPMHGHLRQRRARPYPGRFILKAGDPVSGPTNPAALSFTAPATFTDGTVIPPGTISKYQYGFGTATGVYGTIVDDTDLTTAGGKQVGVVPTNLAFGQWFAAARAVTKDGATAAWGNEIPFVIAAKTPSPITDFSAA